LLRQDLEPVPIALGDDTEPGHPDLGGLAAAVATLLLGQDVLDALGIELEDRPLADVDAGLFQQGDVRGLAAAPLPEEIQASIPLAGATPAGRAAGGETLGIEHLVAGDGGELDAQGVELAGILGEGLAGVVDDAPALLAGDAAVAG